MDQGLNELSENLRRAFEALDSLARSRAARVDAGRVAERVVAALREPAPVAVPIWRRGAWHIAAAIALLLVGASVTVVKLRSNAPVVSTQASAGPSLPVSLPSGLLSDSLGSQAASALLAAVDSSRASAVGDAAASGMATTLVTLDDLSEAELRALLQALESSEGVI